MLRGNQLNEAIESELKEMLKEGIEVSPISHAALHQRLTAKGHIRGGLSTLSTKERKALIQLYIKEQLSPLNLNEQEKQLYTNRKTRQALLESNKALKEKVANLESELLQNTVTLIEIINRVKLKTNLDIDDLLAPNLIPDTNTKAEIKKL